MLNCDKNNDKKLDKDIQRCVGWIKHEKENGGLCYVYIQLEYGQSGIQGSNSFMEDQVGYSELISYLDTKLGTHNWYIEEVSFLGQRIWIKDLRSCPPQTYQDIIIGDQKQEEEL